MNSSDWPLRGCCSIRQRSWFLDEATSALDVETESRLYSLLRDREVAFISVGHRPTLKDFHDTVLELSGDHDWRLIPATSYDFGRS